MSNEVYEWSTTASANDGSGKLFPEGMAANLLNNRLRDMQASIKTYALEYWLQVDENITKVDEQKFRVNGADLRGIFPPQRRIKCGNDIALVVSSTYAGNYTDVTIDRKVFTSNLKVYTALPADAMTDIIDIDDGEHCFANRTYKYKTEYRVCIKEVTSLDKKAWDDKKNFFSIQGLDAQGVKNLGFAKLKLTVDSAKSKLTITET